MTTSSAHHNDCGTRSNCLEVVQITDLIEITRFPHFDLPLCAHACKFLSYLLSGASIAAKQNGHLCELIGLGKALNKVGYLVLRRIV
eukprot:CAMPEP_0169377436 /NCGR_PEP_ID=MMETSP1017-20121227/39196_1 /TAXON_ID=342587 /ORGANISM="Karlodinium micrum, Strain CCMP2283" /LENGTH=86 /DNA_ID=CAMNT_0009476533 /DNA_START=224 /DNA_END=484 /DNA_ORIENTATION=-